MTMIRAGYFVVDPEPVEPLGLVELLLLDPGVVWLLLSWLLLDEPLELGLPVPLLLPCPICD